MSDISKLTLLDNQTYDLKDAQVRQQISPIENSSVASSAYGIGEYLQLNGILYITTAEIHVGDNLVVDTNIEEIKVSEELLKIIQIINDLGLSVVNGKLCVTYEVTT